MITKIIHIIKVTGIAGAERHLITMLPKLDKEKFDISVIVLSEPNGLSQKFCSELDEVGIHNEEMQINGHLDLSLIFKMWYKLRFLSPTIVHTHLLHADLYGSIAAYFGRVPIIVSSRHNDDPFRKGWPLIVVLRLVNRFTSQFIAISERVREYTMNVEKVLPENISTIHYGLCIESLGSPDHCNLRSEFCLPKGSILVCVARLADQKGHKWLLQAFRSVVDQLPDTSLLLLGDGPLRASLENMVENLDLVRNVRFAGWRTDVLRILSNADLFVMTSEWEGFGLVLLEAMSQSLPIVATKVGGIPEVVVHGETGWLVKSKDMKEISSRILDILSSPNQMLTFGQNGKIRVENKFSVKSMVDNIEDTYGSLLDSKVSCSN